MRLLDRYAYSNRIRRLHPAYKAGCSLIAMFLCLGSNQLFVSIPILVLMLGLSIVWAGIPWRFMLKLSLAEGSFLLLSVLSVAVSVSGIPDSGALALGPLWFNLSSESALQAINLLARALGCVAAMNFLALTTPMVDLMELLRRLRVPTLLIDLMGLMYRFIFVLLDSLERMVLAQQVRLGFWGWRNILHSAARIGANLFIEAFRRSLKLETALQGRAWNGDLRVLPHEFEHPFRT